MNTDLLRVVKLVMNLSLFNTVSISTEKASKRDEEHSKAMVRFMLTMFMTIICFRLHLTNSKDKIIFKCYEHESEHRGLNNI